MPTRTDGWPFLLADPHVLRGEGRCPIPAYSEFMPGPAVGLRPNGTVDPLLDSADPHGFPISEYQQVFELEEGLRHLTQLWIRELRTLVTGPTVLAQSFLHDNPYWPAVLQQAGVLKQERFVALTSLALSRTQDDKGRVRWTLFGSSEQGPGRAFWQSFYSAPGVERPADEGRARLERMLTAGCGLSAAEATDRRRPLRILPTGIDPDHPSWGIEPIPSWAQPLLIAEGDAPGNARVLLTFRPFARLPPAVQQAYLSGSLQLLPFPGSLVFFGHAGYRSLARELPGAMQIPLLHCFPSRQVAPTGIRVAQAGWLNEPRPGGGDAGATNPHGRVVSHIKRTSRWNRSHRDEDETTVLEREDRVAHVLFSTEPEQLGLYGKPMARNSQIWTHDYRVLLDGPHHPRYRVDEAAHAIAQGGHFGYRFLFPPMHVGPREVFWHYPLCAAWSPASSEVVPVDAGSGYLTVAPRGATAGDEVELWPRYLDRPGHRWAARDFEHEPGVRKHTTALNLRKLFEARILLGAPLSRDFARSLLTAPSERTLAEWTEATARKAPSTHAEELTAALAAAIAPAEESVAPAPSTFDLTSHRAFEERYWHQIASLAEGVWRNKDNADHAGIGADVLAARDLEALGDHLHERYHALFAKHGMAGRALVADHRFAWKTDFDFAWSGGWVRNQIGRARERNIVVVIPGRNRSEAVVMGDHYDTAYMEDVYEKARGGDLTRRAAAGADDNHSATAALLMAADVLLPLSKAGQLERDVWLVHLTGEEFPADCLGARNLVQRLVEGTLSVDADGHGRYDLSRTEVKAAFILDMVAHNNDHARYEFQISIGEGAGAMRLGLLAHRANARWNAQVPRWNQHAARQAPGPSRRMEDGSIPPPEVAHPVLKGEVRPGWHFKSSLYNTDAQIFSDAGIPVVLFMENYDINRAGYHDSNDTMKNIDLDYGAAVAAIAIETVTDAARAETL